MQIQEKKIECRREIRKRQQKLTADYIAKASKKICEKVLSLEKYKKSKTIMLYVSVGTEVVTDELISCALKEGKEICLPKCLDIDENGNKIQAENQMEARLYSEEYPLVEGAYGIPAPNSSSPIIQPSEIDLVILPCVSCDRNCNRLGHGAGYYDRFIAKLRQECGKIAVCYEKIILDEIPTESHDIKMDMVITENSIY